jgi:hypothetical protein
MGNDGEALYKHVTACNRRYLTAERKLRTARARLRAVEAEAAEANRQLRLALRAVQPELSPEAGELPGDGASSAPNPDRPARPIHDSEGQS